MSYISKSLLNNFARAKEKTGCRVNHTPCIEVRVCRIVIPFVPSQLYLSKL